MRILMLVTDGYGRLGGIAQYNRDFLAALSASPLVETVQVWPRNMARTISERIPEAVIYERRFAGGKWRYAICVVTSLLLAPSYDLVICAHLHLLPLAWLAAARRGAALALIVYGVEAWRPTAYGLTNFLARRVDRLISISDVTQRRFCDWAGSTAASVKIPPGVDLDRFRPGLRPHRLAVRYGVDGRRVMMTIGRLVASERYKGFDQIIELMPRLRGAMPDLRYLIVGDGDDRTRLEKKAQDLGVQDRVIFAGSISEDEKVDHFRLADLCAMPSSGEGFGIVLIEAAATGAALIGGVGDGTREALVDGALGTLVDPSQTDALYKAIVEALSAAAPRRRRPGVELFSREAFNERVADWLRQMFPIA